VQRLHLHCNSAQVQLSCTTRGLTQRSNGPTTAGFVSPVCGCSISFTHRAYKARFRGPFNSTLNDSFPKSSTAALGRVATDTSPDSSSESRRWRFASRKLPLADESCRPIAVTSITRKWSSSVTGETKVLPSRQAHAQWTALGLRREG